ncbi:YdeI/OmpD-associated family protein [Parvularcula sp. LCG005]|uniref:YdeI/OmpD-associated family protein n=1 Tax=Parvularcula sp. LCG005 TaxID=3078805 RepID=UPI002942179E|nr:YdeI/OmpD-associated family protein [Parvularcula sp. LCG005]WOI53467.1 YdeI/OmpD-associated family protein [Parvularcula sp. LCG005]
MSRNSHADAAALDGEFENAALWREEALQLRAILQSCDLDEALKWSKPCYGRDGQNVAIIQRFNSGLALLFFKGALLDDPKGLLEVQGPQSRSGHRMMFMSVNDIRQSEQAIRDFIKQAIALNDAGARVQAASPPAWPAELSEALAVDAVFDKAFRALTPGRQRGYCLYFEGAKQSKTRHSRIARYRSAILSGKGLLDR